MNQIKQLLMLTFWLLSVQSLSAQTLTLDDFPVLSTIIDQDNCCQNESVIFYDMGDVQFFYVANDADCFGEGGRLFFGDGSLHCEDGVTDCLEFYGLTTGGQVIYQCDAPQSDLDLFDRFSFLSSVVDVDACQGEVIEYYRNSLKHEFLCVVTPDARTWYYPDGTLACQSDGSFDCPTLYGFGEMELIDLFICDSDNNGGGIGNSDAVGAVYAMTNGQGQVPGNVQGPNSVVAYAQAADGTLTPMGSFPTGGNGGDFDGGEGLDPLISAYAITKSNDNRFVMAVNAGSNTVTTMRVNPDYSLEVVDTESTLDIGPNSIAYVPSRLVGVNGFVYVSNITRSEFLALGEPGQQGSIVGYKLMNDGTLEPIANSRRELANRPSAVQFSPDGDFVVVASINSGAAALGSGSEDELVIYRVNNDGTLSDTQLDGVTSTLRGNTAGRNLPSAIGFQIVGDNYVVVTEAREFQSDGTPPAFPALQDGSVSTWQIDTDGMLIPVDLDVASGTNNTGRTACWLDFSDENTFFVSNAIEAGLAAYTFNDGDIELINQVAAQGTGATGNTTDPAAAFGTTEGWIDLWISDDGQYLYQAYGLSGEVGVYAIDGTELTLLQEIGGLPQNNIQGIVSVGQLPDDANELTATYRVTFDALWSQTSHPNDFPFDTPNEARWSPVAGLTHNSSVRLFNEGDIATTGLVNISQTGSRDPIDSELADVIATGAGEHYIESATRVRPSPDTISTTFEISSSHPLFSATSMIAPSPDWLVALRDFNLMRNGEFIESAVAQFIPYDTGSDSGETFRSDNQDTQPRQPITRITDGLLADEDGNIRSLGIWRFERIDSGSNCDVEGGTITGGPYTFTVDGTADNIPEDGISLTANNGGNSQWVVTDASGYILGLPPTFSAPDFDEAGVGLCYVYHMSYEDGLTGLAVGNNIAQLEGCFDLSNQIYVNRVQGANAGNFVGGVFAMTNGQGQVDGNVQGPNSVVAYGQAADGTLTLIGDFPTGGNGGDFDGGEGLDPLISAYAITKSLDNQFVMAVNAGSNTVTSMRVNDDFTLTVVDTESTLDIGPNSIAYVPSRVSGVNGFVYVSNIARTENLALGEPGQEGSIVGYKLMDDGSLLPIEGSRRELNNRPSAIQFSPDGDFVVVASINAGAAGLANGNQDEVVVYGVNPANGTLTEDQLSGATSTLRGNAENRNLPSAIGFQIVGENILVVTEAREFRADGSPPVFPGLQDGSVSTWQITNDGQLEPIALDVATGVNNTGRTACWLDFSDDNTFFVSNAIEAGLASFTFNDGNVQLVNQVAAQGTGATGNTTDGASAFATTEGWIDLWISDDGQYLYQCYGLTGEVGVYAINGTELTLLQEIGGLPQNNVQGIVSVGQPQIAANEATAEYRLIFDALWSQQSHPNEFPLDPPNEARWSPVAGLTHNSSVRLFNDGDIVSQGLVNISQSGSRDPLDSELAAVVNSPAGEFYIESLTRVRPSPDTISTTFKVTESHSLVSVTSMIAPSPDWMVALRDYNLFQNGEFVESAIAQFIPYDTNSDSGETFRSDNQPTVPQGGIFEITDGLLADENGNINSLGVWRFERIDAGSNCNVAGGSIAGGPFTFDVDGTPDNIPADGITLSGNTGANSQWVITDANGYILGLPGSFTGPDFDEAGPGLCYVYHLSYDEISGLEMGNNIADFSGCFSLSNEIYVKRVQDDSRIVGAVYAMSNGEGQVPGILQGPNSVVAYAQAADGTLTAMGSFPTGGNGGDFDGGEGLDPLISAYAITKSNDNRYVMAVNAGSNTITSMRVNDDFTLEVVDTESTFDIGPNSIAYVPSRLVGVNGLVYVSNITRSEFLLEGEPAQQGSIVGFKLMNNGRLEPIEDSRRRLANRPSAVQFSPDGDFVVVASINSGSAALASGSEDEIVVYSVNADGTLSDDHLDGATSTLRGNAENRNLPSAIGFQIVGDNIVVVTEAREFQADGTPPAFPALQDGSVSTWQIENDGTLVPIALDVASGTNNTGRTACWLDFSDDNTFFVSNAIEAGLASYSFNDGNIQLINQVAAQGTGATGNTTDPAAAFGTTEGWIDLWISDDGQYLYQAYGLSGEVGVYAIDGTELTLLQEIGGLPSNNIQGIVSVGQKPDDANEVTATYRVTFDALWSEVSHPTDFPADTPNEARWSPVAGLTHNASVRLFNEGDIATPGLVNISQTGSRDPIDSELANVILTGAGETYIESATRVRPSPDTISTTFEISSSHPLFSATSMIAPSPDWIVALRDFNLMRDGEFVESAIAQFIPYDTGSDSGETFRSDNQDTQPRQPISRITDGVLAGEDGSIRSLGIWRFERIDNLSTCDVEGGTITGGPFTFTVDGIADNIPEDGITLRANNGANSQWVVTDASGYILGLPPTFSAPEFDEAGVGLCYVYHMSYEDGLTGLAVGNNIAQLEGCFDLSNQIYVNRVQGDASSIVGAVFAMSNGEGQVAGNVQGPNSVVAFGQSADGTLTPIGEFPTGGNGGDFDGGEGLDPLISAYAITKSLDNRFVLAVNAGSNTVTSMAVNDDFSLDVIDTESTLDVGPNSIAYTPADIEGVNGLIYVSNITQAEFLDLGEPGQQGSVAGYWLLDDGTLMPIEGSRRILANRPSAIQFSPEGDYVVVASINSGAAALGSGSEDEIVLYSVNEDGTLSANQLDGATSTLRGNSEGRNLPSAIGFQIVGDNYVVVTEAREFQPDGTPPAFPALQDGSVSTWQIVNNAFVPVDLDVASGTNNTGRTACWLDFSDDNTFFVSNAIEAGLAAYSFNNGDVELLDQVAAQGTGATGNTTDPAAAFGTTEGWIDLWISDDGQYLYQAYGLSGEVGVYAIDGTELTLLQEVGGLPQNNIQGIVSVGAITEDAGIFDRDETIAALASLSSSNDNPTGIIGGDLIATNRASSERTFAGMSVYPNPTSGNVLSLEFELQVATDYTLSILSVDGSRTIQQTNMTGRAAGIYTETLDISPLNSGVYIVQLNDGENVMFEKFIIQK